MDYADGRPISLGDQIAYGPARQIGGVVCSVDDGAYSEDFPFDEWATYLGAGILIRFENGALLHLKEVDNWLSFSGSS